MSSVCSRKKCKFQLLYNMLVGSKVFDWDRVFEETEILVRKQGV